MMQPLMSNTHYLLRQFFLFLADGAVFWVTLDRFCPLQFTTQMNFACQTFVYFTMM